ncbi:diguanylate cyclase [Ancylobacter novellus DSM 506]|uniref:diguanylate cyclase n=1 Tax=Ancylobacter novellus (strain ATCC 8093 / DSM 506 / JCM 20403 / CCM 1077 / IAM 12100 / NBRC 12443 / NCIMB 10456) TaxID=639283 RepID=D7A2E4_ANCN5|nr:GGDEF domain-containing protein [Ancylobacter novellus]ADH89607.1 diguanylate cyclase [Ancylobacter novellus DSM 506]
MRGATFLLVINFAIGLSFAAAFLLLTWRTDIRIGRWCAAGFLCAAATVAVEAVVPFLPGRLASALSFSFLMLAVTLIVVGLARHYRPDMSLRPILALFVLAEAVNLLLRYDLPRPSLIHALIYQLPYAAMLALGAGIVLASGRRRLADLALLAVLAAGSLHFAFKAIVPLFATGPAPDVRDYILSIYAYYSQTMAAVLALLLGLSVLGVIIAELMAETARRLERDSLSGVLSRAAFMERAAALLAALRPEERACLVMCDLDHFKSINDRFGHAAGDEVIRAFGGVLAERASVGALCGRIGGEEFCLLLPEGDVGEAQRRIEAVRSAMDRLRYALVPGEIRVTASFGLAVTGRGEHIDEALRRADLALYAAKAAGRDRHMLAQDAPERRGGRAS